MDSWCYLGYSTALDKFHTSGLRAEASRAETKRSIDRDGCKTDVGGVNDTSDKRVNYLMASSVQNGPKTMFFKDYSLLVVFNAYLRSKCTTSDIYTCDGAGLVVIR